MSAEWVMNRTSPSIAVCLACSMISAITRSLVSPWIALNLTSGVRLARSVNGLVDQEDARLDEENFLAQPRQTMGMSHGGIRLRAATWPIHIMYNQCLHSSSKEKPARAGGHLAGFSTGVLAQSGLGVIADPIDDLATLNSIGLPPGARC